MQFRTQKEWGYACGIILRKAIVINHTQMNSISYKILCMFMMSVVPMKLGGAKY